MLTRRSEIRLPDTTRAVLFDLDDTLVDHRGAARAGLLSWIGTVGLSGEVNEHVERWHALEVQHFSAHQRGTCSFSEQRRRRVRAFLPHLALDTDAAADEAFAGYLTCYRTAWRAFHDAERALRRAHSAGVRIAVLTNGEEAHQRSKVHRVGLATVLDELRVPVLVSSTIGAPKPRPEAYAIACERLGARPEQAVMIGDSVANDVRGARAAGLAAVLVDRYDEHPTTPARVRSLDQLTYAA